MTMKPKLPHLKSIAVGVLILLTCYSTLPIHHPTRAVRAGTPVRRVSASVPALPATPELVLSQPLTLRWVYGSDRTTNFTPANDAKSIYLPLVDGTLVALNASDG